MTVDGGPAGSEVRLRPGVTRIEVAPGPEASLGLRRFATGEYPVPIEALGGSTTLLRIPPDASSRPWRLQAIARQGAEVCRPPQSGL